MFYLNFTLKFQVQNEYIYPKEQTLSRLRMSQAAIERKISLCRGPIKSIRTVSLAGTQSQRRKQQLIPSFIQVDLKLTLIKYILPIPNYDMLYKIML